MTDQPYDAHDRALEELQRKVEAERQRVEAREAIERTRLAQPENQADSNPPAEAGEQDTFKKLVADKTYDAPTQARSILDRPGIAEMQNPPDVSFTDDVGRPITIRTWKSGDQAYIRAYDIGKTQVPERVTPGLEVGGAGYANVTVERLGNDQTKVRLHDIWIQPEYRRAGISGQILNQVEQFARENNASEIYGSIENQDAHNYWASQADRGWTIAPKGAYGEAHYKV